MANLALVRWGGHIFYNAYGVDYNGGLAATFDFVHTFNFAQLVQMMETYIGIRDSAHISSVTFRQPILRKDEMYFYTAVPVANDYQLFLALENCNSIPISELYEFYVDFVYIEGSHPPIVHSAVSAGPSTVGANIITDDDDDDDDDEVDDDEISPVFYDQDEDDDKAKAEAETNTANEEGNDWTDYDDIADVVADVDDDVGVDDDDEQDILFQNAVLPLIHPPPYAQIDLSLMKINTYSKSGGNLFDPSHEFAEGMMFSSRGTVTKGA